MRFVVSKMWTLEAYLASSTYTGTVVGPSRHEEICVTMLSMPDSQRARLAFQSNFWAPPWVTHGPYPTRKPPTWLFCSCFYPRFHLHTSYNLTGCAIRILLSPSPEYEVTRSSCSLHNKKWCHHALLVVVDVTISLDHCQSTALTFLWRFHWFLDVLYCEAVATQWYSSTVLIVDEHQYVKRKHACVNGSAVVISSKKEEAWSGTG